MNTWSRAPSQVLELAGFAAVFWAMSAVPIVFEEGFQRDAVKLIELPGDLADALEAESRPLVMRGSLDDNVVIVTDRKTYAVNLVETSNTVLLVRPSADAHTLGVHSVLGCHYEMIETVPDLARVRSLLREHEIGVNDLPLFFDDMDGAGLRFDELADCVQASDAQIETALDLMDAIEIRGRWFSLSVELVNRALSNVLDVALSCGFQLDRLPVDEVVHELQGDFPELLIKHIVRVFSVGKNYDRDAKLDESAVCRQVAIRILLEEPKVPFEAFMTRWQLEAPGLMTPETDMLRGVALIDESVRSRTVMYVPIESLPSDPAKRFEALFSLKQKWAYEDLVAYLSDLVAFGHPLEPLILKHTRAVQQGAFYISRRSNKPLK
ncbi:unnamed protein product (mitochondrion) [Plasmodiophora brassicae]|uniref:Sister chromatid cohesion protein DCC1 n=2 Tax=Plasmodiophora brassicae TaxID=37360 RepID=A0A3P3Y3C1_PLABS|nr:unnamed protein product [Plasmodiophora brassicae]